MLNVYVSNFDAVLLIKFVKCIRFSSVCYHLYGMAVYIFICCLCFICI